MLKKFLGNVYDEPRNKSDFGATSPGNIWSSRNQSQTSLIIKEPITLCNLVLLLPIYTYIYVQYTAGSGWLVRLFLMWTTSIKGRHIKYLTEVCAFSLVVHFWLIWEESYLLFHISMEFTGSRYNGETQNGKWVTEPGHGIRTSGPMDSTAVSVVWLI